MQVKINGTDITTFIAPRGLKWQRNDVDAPDAGRFLDAEMQRKRVAIKERLDITCRPLTDTEVYTLMNLIEPEFVSVTYKSPLLGTRTATFYSNNVPASYLFKDSQGAEWWDGITFPLIEK
ncbi:MAG: hypothetical protein KBS62_03135 [Oscillospiraceae bacterium]|nr:hypothetical protein [Candidatus Ruminococcus equi]